MPPVISQIYWLALLLSTAHCVHFSSQLYMSEAKQKPAFGHFIPVTKKKGKLIRLNELISIVKGDLT